MTQQAPSRPPGAPAPATPTGRLARALRMPHVLRLGRLRPAVPAAAARAADARDGGRRWHVSRGWWVTGAVVLAALVGLMVWVVLASPWLVVKRVEVEGATAATREQVAQVADVPVGTPLARVPLGDIADRVRTITSVAEVSVTRSWPSTVTITVTQATPAAVMRDGRGFALISTVGQPYRTVESRPDGLPMVAAPVSQLDDPATRAAAEVAVAIGASDADLVRRLVDRVSATDPLQVTVVLRDGTRVSWGSAAGSPVKARTLQLLLRADPHASGYDVSAPSAPSVTP